MNTKRTFTVVILLLLLSMFSASCGGNQASQQDYTPLSADNCSAINAALSKSAGIQGEITPSAAFEDYINSKKGSGCQISFTATGQTFDNYTGLSNPAESALVNLGWQTDIRYDAAGAGSYSKAYTKDKNLCLMAVASEPSDPSLCPSDEPVAICWEKLAPEQKIFNLTLNCAQANFP